MACEQDSKKVHTRSVLTERVTTLGSDIEESCPQLLDGEGVRAAPLGGEGRQSLDNDNSGL